jgi:hypothetical protein
MKFKVDEFLFFSCTNWGQQSFGGQKNKFFK